MKQRRAILAFCWTCLAVAPLSAQWQNVAPGIDYAEYTLSTPNNVFVARMARSAQNGYIESSIPMGVWGVARETVSGMAQRYQDAIGYWGSNWGTRHNVVVAINGDFFDYATSLPLSGQVHSGWYCKRFEDLSGVSGFVWRTDRSLFIGDCVYTNPAKQIVKYQATGQSQTLTDLNVPPGTNQITLYMPQFGANTGTDNTVDEVLVQLDSPALIKPSPAYVRGTVIEVRSKLGSTRLPFDCVVLCARGTAATKLLANATVGSEVRLSQEITHYQENCSSSNSNSWANAYASVGGNRYFLRNSVVQTYTDSFATARHPRTAVAYNNTYVFFFVVDGRTSISLGMSLAEMGNFCKNTLGATQAVNLDGGGSSEMWVNGEIKNWPSDGTERPCGNGLMMVTALDKQISNRFAAQYVVKTLGRTNLHLGPGNNHLLITQLAPQTEGEVQAHPLQGVYARGYHWWKCKFGGTEGWASQTMLGLVSRPPVVADYNKDGHVDAGDFDTFSGCYNGPVNPTPTGCTAVDMNQDNHVDSMDFDIFSACYNGPVEFPGCR